MAEQSNTKETHRFWKNFWKLEILNKIKTFGWRLFHNGLPTMNNLLRRGCLVENACRHCGFQMEDALHLFRDCWWVKSVPQDVNLPGEVWNNQCTDPGYWIWLCAKLCSKEDFKALICGLWLTWKDRNERVHGKEGSFIEPLRLKLRWLLKEWRIGLHDLRWWDIQKDRYKDDPLIYCDGSFDQEQKEAGIGAVLFVNGVTQAVKASWLSNINSVLEAEYKAVKLELEMAREMTLAKVTLLIDSRECVWALDMGTWRTNSCLVELKDCIGAMDANPGWEIGSVNRTPTMQQIG
ncbi:hypothetical protein QQ045_016933 [Rhodiola kirilowii]